VYCTHKGKRPRHFFSVVFFGSFPTLSLKLGQANCTRDTEERKRERQSKGIESGHRDGFIKFSYFADFVKGFLNQKSIVFFKISQ
jgi:hypothetical protein